MVQNKNEYDRQYYAKNRDRRRAQIAERNRVANDRNKAQLREYLSDKRCADCLIEDWRVLTFDHVRDVKRRDVATMITGSYSWQAILDEIAKCEIVCANCHQIRTANEFGFWRSQAVEA